MEMSPPLPPALACELANPLFRGVARPLFRRAEDDGEPALVVRMGQRDGVVPLRALQARLGIPDASPDGQMLARIAQALDFVQEIRPGDPLPAEVLTGEASWRPEPSHFHIASRRLRGRLIQWLQAIGAPGQQQLLTGDFDRAEHDPALAARLHTAFGLIAARLQLPDALDAIALMESLSEELACIEALRECLLAPMRGLARKLDIVSQARRGEGMNAEMLMQVRRLCRAGLQRIGARFGMVDRLTEDIVSALSGGADQQLVIRANRDWLHRTYRAFAPLLSEWETAPADIDKDFWGRLTRTYRFLAPRYMPVHEWKQATRIGQ